MSSQSLLWTLIYQRCPIEKNNFGKNFDGANRDYSIKKVNGLVSTPKNTSVGGWSQNCNSEGGWSEKSGWAPNNVF